MCIIYHSKNVCITLNFISSIKYRGACLLPCSQFSILLLGISSQSAKLCCDISESILRRRMSLPILSCFTSFVFASSIILLRIKFLRCHTQSLVRFCQSMLTSAQKSNRHLIKFPLSYQDESYQDDHTAPEQLC